MRVELLSLRSFSLSMSMIAPLCLVGACEEPPAPTYAVVFEGVEGPEAPLAGVAVAAAGQPLGATDADGRITAELSGPEGTTVPLAITCPEGHRAPPSIPALTLRRTHDLSTGLPTVLRVTVTCPPTLRHGVVILRASGEGDRSNIPVLIDGVEMARTDRSGVAHVALDRAPGSSISVMLATATVLPDVTPRNPSMGFTFPDGDEIFVFDRPLEAPAPPPEVRRPWRGPRTPPAETGTRPPCNLRTGVGCR